MQTTQGGVASCKEARELFPPALTQPECGNPAYETLGADSGSQSEPDPRRFEQADREAADLRRRRRGRMRSTTKTLRTRSWLATAQRESVSLRVEATEAEAVSWDHPEPQILTRTRPRSARRVAKSWISSFRPRVLSGSSAVSRIKSILPRCTHPRHIGNYPFRAAVDFNDAVNCTSPSAGGAPPADVAPEVDLREVGRTSARQAAGQLELGGSDGRAEGSVRLM